MESSLPLSFIASKNCAVFQIFLTFYVALKNAPHMAHDNQARAYRSSASAIISHIVRSTSTTTPTFNTWSIRCRPRHCQRLRGHPKTTLTLKNSPTPSLSFGARNASSAGSASALHKVCKWKVPIVLSAPYSAYFAITNKQKHYCLLLYISFFSIPYNHST